MNKMSIIEQFENYRLDIKGQSIGTINGYIKDLKMFFNYLGLDIDNLTIEQLDSINTLQLEQFISYCKNERKCSANTCNRKVCSLKAFFEFCYDKLEIIGNNPSKKLEKSKLPVRKPVYLTEEESINYINAIDLKKKNGLRNLCMTVFMRNLGVRVSELVNIKIGDIQGDILTVIGKGNKQRNIVMNTTCLKVYNDYLEKRMLIDTDSEYLFLNPSKQQLKTGGVEKFMRELNKKIGIDKHITPHKLRHTCATLLHKGGADDFTIQKILGHESIATTQIYTHVDMDDMRKAVQMIG